MSNRKELIGREVVGDGKNEDRDGVCNHVASLKKKKMVVVWAIGLATVMVDVVEGVRK